MPVRNSRKVHLNNQRKLEIIALASEVFTQYFSDPPANPLEVLADHGITHSFGHYGDCFDGMLEYEGGEFHVYCNLDRGNAWDSGRGRFTLAHELAHYFIDEHRIALMSGRIKPHPSKGDNRTGDLLPEQEADLFASYFLMPEDLCKRTTTKMGSGYEAIKKLSTVFQVSLHCAAIRYVENKTRPAALILWNERGYAWKRVSDRLWSMGCRKTVEDVKSVIRDSATDQMIRSGASGPTVYESHSTLGAWFPAITSAGVRDIVVREQAMNLGRFGVMTLIEPMKLNQTSAELRFSALSDSLAHWGSN
jgi:Zn-dependent peptidase ImmA (M78 family)